MVTIGVSDADGLIAARRSGNGIAHRLRTSENWGNFYFGDSQLSRTLFLVALSSLTLERFLRQIRVYIALAKNYESRLQGFSYMTKLPWRRTPGK